MLDIQKTIQFCGDSCCENVEGYPSILANKLNAEIVGLGTGGSAYERAIRSYKEGIDYTVFCWTMPNRVFTENRLTDLNYGNCFSEWEDKKKIHQVGALYFKYLDNLEYYKIRQMRELYWFDHEILSKSTSKIIHCFNFLKTYTFKNGHTLHDTLINTYEFHENYDYELKNTTFSPNHLSIEDNELFADVLYSKFNDRLLFA